MGFELYLDDCAKVLPLLTDRKIYAAIFDPPYGLGENREKVMSRGTSVVAPTDYGEFDWDDKPARPEDIAAICKLTKFQAIWGGNYYSLPPTSCWLVWDKQQSGDFADAELCWTNLKSAVRIFQHQWNGMIRKTERHKRVHPSQKPVALMRWVIEKMKIPKGATILDPYMGSAPVGIAALQMGYNYIGIERDERYYKIAQQRLVETVNELEGKPKNIKGDPLDYAGFPLFEAEVAQ